MTDSTRLRVLGISGSLRAGSFNTGLLRAAIELAPPDVTITLAEIRDIPPYDDDVRLKGFPEPVARLREQIATADALLVAMPEFNYSIPGVLKNAIDWASRPPNQPFDGKPLAIMGASGGNYGTARSQYHLRQVAVFVNMFPINKPEVMVTRAQEKFEGGKLTDEPTRKVIAQQIAALAEWTRRLRRGAAPA